MSPCGAVMDYIRSPYTVPAVFRTNPPLSGEMSWYESPTPDTFFPGRHRFGSLNWRGRRGQSDLGERKTQPIYNGFRPKGVYTAENYCPSIDAFRTGLPVDAVPLTINPDALVPTCCGSTGVVGELRLQLTPWASTEAFELAVTTLYSLGLVANVGDDAESKTWQQYILRSDATFPLSCPGASGFVSERYEITLTGVLNGGCSGCSEFNRTHLLTHEPEFGCFWRSELFSFCGGAVGEVWLQLIGGVWQVSCHRNLLGMVIWSIADSLWDYHGSTVVANKGVFTGHCDFWPDSVTVVPVSKTSSLL